MNQVRTDEDLIQQIKEGDELAFKILFNKYYRLLCYAAYKIYPDEHKSKDFAQEVFMDFWRRRASIQIQISLKAFLRRAVVNKTIDFIRAQRFDFEENVELKDHPVSPDRAIEHTELKDLIHHSVEQLPERCRMVFAMSRFEEMSHKEIAAKLEISEKTVENQITKALKLLRSVVHHYMSELKLILLFYWSL